MFGGCKGQIVFEFMFWVGIAMIFGIVVLSVMAVQLHDEVDRRNYKYYQELSEDIRSELVLASVVNPGYRKVIYISENEDYNLTVSNSFLVISYGSNHFSLRIPQLNGTLSKGNNTLYNRNGVIVVE